MTTSSSTTKDIHSNSFYPAKLLLFGEHTVLQGSQALAVPLWQFGGKWAHTLDTTLQYDLSKFMDYLDDLVTKDELDLDTEGGRKALESGLCFSSNIPRGYGAGSSGALVAAIYDKFSKNKPTDLMALKTIFGKMESYFHGASSGFDPLICYIKTPVLIKKEANLVQLQSVNNDLHIFLLDTHIPRKAENLIKIFADRCQVYQYKALVINELVPEIDNAITSFIENMPDLLFETIHKISHFQYRYFPEAVPLAYKNVWLEGLSSDTYKLKLCGAGGGGFILGFCKNWDITQQTLLKSGLSIIPIHKKNNY